MSGTWIEQLTPKARRRHRCDMCGRTIDRGERYLKATWVEEREGFYRWKLCQHCQRTEERLPYSYASDGMSPEAMLEYLEDHHPDLAYHFQNGWLTPFGLLPVSAIDAEFRLAILNRS